MTTRFDVHSACSFEGDGRVNEDFFGWTDSAAWVLDGATGVSRETLPYPSDAYWFVRTFSEHLHRNLVETPSASTLHLLNSAVATTRRKFEHLTGLDAASADGLPSAAFVLIRVLGQTLEITSLGDCKALFRDDRGVVRVFYDPSLEPFENRTLQALESLRQRSPDSLQHDLIQELKPTIRENRKSMNQPGGYRVLSLNSIDESSIETASVTIQDGEIIALTSDGFLRYTEVFKQDSSENLFRQLTDGQPATIVKAVRRLESGDADCKQYIRVKKSDDATCLVVRVSMTSL